MSKKTVPERRSDVMSKKTEPETLKTDEARDNEYEVTVINNANQAWQFFLYQKPPPDATAAQSLAWIASPYKIEVGGRIKFSWSISYQFVWADTGELAPGVHFSAGGIKDGDLQLSNQTTFSVDNNAPSLSDPTGGGIQGSLTINDADNVPANKFSVGVAMSGKGTYVVNAGPNLKHYFTPEPSYWVCAINEVDEGEVMNIQTITQNKEFKFTNNVFKMTATLNGGNLWEIE